MAQCLSGSFFAAFFTAGPCKPVLCWIRCFVCSYEEVQIILVNDSGPFHQVGRWCVAGMARIAHGVSSDWSAAYGAWGGGAWCYAVFGIEEIVVTRFRLMAAMPSTFVKAKLLRGPYGYFDNPKTSS